MRSSSVQSSNQNWSARMADTMMVQMPILSEKWDYDWGVTLTGIEQVYRQSKEEKYLEYIRQNIDHFVQPDGSIPKYNLAEYNLDRINTGKLLFFLFDQLHDERYQKALFLLRSQLATHPRTKEGGFWHKQIYPHQMWLDGIYMAAPFYTEYGARYGDKEAFEDVALQITLMEKNARDPKTGLLYHGWDESRQQRWSDPMTGCSPHFWSRAMGWYAMALVDVLDQYPQAHPQRKIIAEILVRLMAALEKVQDQPTGLWYQVLDAGGREGNYLEASGSCMFVYAIFKGVRLNILAPAALSMARKGYEGIIRHFIRVADDQVYLDKTCAVAGLGGNPYRDGSYRYYVGEPIRTNDPKGVGAFILASVENERQ